MKCFFKKAIKSISVLSLSSLLLFTSCDSFFTGSNLKEEIQKQIEYAKAEVVNIQINAKDATYGTTTPSGSKEYKVSDNIALKFKESDNYKFLKWVVLDANGNPLENVVEIINPLSLETSALVKAKADYIHICPEVILRPMIQDFSPSYSDAGEPKDSSIVISFNKNISPDNDFSNIEISIAGESVKDSFYEPTLNENILTIPANKSRLISIESGKTKTVTVKIPADIYYVDNDVNVPIGSETVYSYKINSYTNDKAEITFSVASEKGSITPMGTQKYDLGSSFTLEYIPNENYAFTGWKIVDRKGSAITKSVLNVQSPSSIKTNVTVNGKISGASITPLCYLVPSATLTSPEYILSGANCDSSIIVKFNTAIDISSFRFSEDEIPAGAVELYDSDYLCYGYTLDGNTYFKNIYIENANTAKNLSEHYNYPVLSADGKTLTLTAKYDNLLLPSNSSDLVNVNVTVNTERSVVNLEGNTIPEIYNAQFRLNSKRENQPPSIYDFVIAKNNIDIEKIRNGEMNSLSSKVYDDWEEEDFISNLVSKVHIYTKGYEADTKLSKIKIRESFIREWTSTEVNKKPEIIEKYCDGIFKEVEGEDGTWEGYFTYDFDSDEDGIVKLEFIVEDYHQNGTPIGTYYFNKDTQIYGNELFIISENNLYSYGYSERVNITNLFSDSNFNEYDYYSQINDVAYIPNTNYYSIVDEGGDVVSWIIKITDRFLTGKTANYFDDYKKDVFTDFEYEVKWAESLADLDSDSCFSSGRLSIKDVGYKYIYHSNSKLSANDPLDPAESYSACEAALRYRIPSLNKNKDYYYKVIAYDRADNEVADYGIKPKALKINSAIFSNNKLDISVKPSAISLPELEEYYMLLVSFDEGESFTSVRKNSSEALFDSPSFSADINNPYSESSIQFVVKPVYKHTILKSLQGIGYGASSTEHYSGGQVSFIQTREALDLLEDDSSITIPEIDYYFTAMGESTGKQLFTLSIENNNYDVLYVKTKINSDDTNYTNIAFEPNANSLSYELDTDLVYNNYYSFYLVMIKDGAKHEEKLITPYLSNIEYNKPPVLISQYLTLDTFGDYLILNAPISQLNIEEENITCYYKEILNYTDPLYNSYAHSDADRGILLTKNAILLPEEIRTFNKLPVSYYSDTDHNKIKIPVKDLPNKNYIICLDVTDEGGNNTCSSYVYFVNSNSATGYTTPIQYSARNIISKASDSPGNGGNTGNFTLTIQQLNSSSKKWNDPFVKDLRLKAPDRANAYAYSFDSNLTGNTFYRVYVKGNTQAWQSNPKTDDYGALLNGATCSLYSNFAYPQYMYLRTDSSTPCNLPLPAATAELKEGLAAAFAYFTKHQDVTDLTGTDEIVINSDYPVLVQTVYNKTNWSQVNEPEAKNAVFWEQHTPDSQIKNIQVLSPSVNKTAELMLYRIDTTYIPAGYYYTIIAHFADGTTKMSSVKQK